MAKEESRIKMSDLVKTVQELVFTKDGIKSVKMLGMLDIDDVKELAKALDDLTVKLFGNMVRDYLDKIDQSTPRSKGEKLRLQKITGTGLIKTSGKFNSILSKLMVMEQNLDKKLF